MDDLELTATNSIMIIGRRKRKMTEEQKAKKKLYFEKHRDEINKRHREYYEKHKDELIRKKHEYYEKHKDKLIEKKEHYRTPVLCTCGETVKKGWLLGHLKTKRHHLLLSSI